jgi:hypothetical protein
MSPLWHEQVKLISLENEPSGFSSFMKLGSATAKYCWAMAGRNEPPTYRAGAQRTPSFSFILLILGALGVFAVQNYFSTR